MNPFIEGVLAAKFTPRAPFISSKKPFRASYYAQRGEVGKTFSASVGQGLVETTTGVIAGGLGSLLASEIFLHSVDKGALTFVAGTVGGYNLINSIITTTALTLHAYDAHR